DSLAAGTAGYILKANGSGNAPSWIATSSLAIAISDTTGVLTTDRGGTGLTGYATGDILYASTPTTLAKLPVGLSNQILLVSGGLPTWASTGPGTAHEILSAQHSDTVAASKSQGDFMVVKGSGSWERLVAGTGGQMIIMNDSDPTWTTYTGSSSIITVGTIVTGTWNSTPIGTAYGGLGQNVNPGTIGTILYANSGTTYATLAAGTAGTILKSNGTAAPSWIATSSLAIAISDTTGVLTTDRGGTGFSSYTTGDILFASGSALVKLPIGSGGQVLNVADGIPQWVTADVATSSHDLLSSTHLDASPSAVVRGSLITGQGSSAQWTRLGLGTSGQLLTSDGTDVIWQTYTGSTSIITLGTISTGTWQASTIGVQWGGTGAQSITGMVKGNGTGAMTGITSSQNYVAYWSDANTIAGEQYLSTTRGGLGANVTALGAGELLYSTATNAYDSLAAGTA
ncbi:hypothetical protein AUJ44_00430, partial [Candidatus Nomurabacteria bacterium CG1_02_47_685]